MLKCKIEKGTTVKTAPNGDVTGFVELNDAVLDEVTGGKVVSETRGSETKYYVYADSDGMRGSIYYQKGDIMHTDYDKTNAEKWDAIFNPK